MSLKPYILASLCLILVACAHPPKAPLNQNISWAKRKPTLAHITRWQLSGSTAIATQTQTLSANLNWQQWGPKQYRLSLSGPLGLGAVKLLSNKHQVTLYAQNKTYQSQNAESLLLNELGWQLPVNRFYYWIRGLDAPGSTAKLRFDRYHHLKSITSPSWSVRYEAYQNVDGIDLPKKIFFSSSVTRAVIVIQHWQLS